MRKVIKDALVSATWLSRLTRETQMLSGPRRWPPTQLTSRTRSTAVNR